MVAGAAIDRLPQSHPPKLEAVDLDVACTVDFFLHGVCAGDNQ
jgi:hypothetical protein